MFDAIVGFIGGIFSSLYQVTVSMGVPSYALAIVMVTIIIKAITWPLMSKQMKSMMNMQEVQPKMQRLQQKYKNNPEKMNEEMMKLYKEYDVNPMAGCLPLLIQMPILIGIYTALREYQFEPLEHATFFWVPNLNSPDPWYILPIFVGLTMYFQQKISMKGQEEAMAANPMMKSMLYVMPPMMGFMCLQFPSGLCLYWGLFSLLGIVQQYFMNIQRDKLKAEMAERRAAEEAALAEEKKKAMMAKKKKAAKKAVEENEVIEDAIIVEESETK